MAPRIAYLADGKVHLKLDDAPPRILESPFIDGVRSREASIIQRNAWKSQGATALLAGRLGGGQDDGGAAAFAEITGLSRGRVSGEILYSIQTSVVTGLFALDAATGEEKRLFHANQYRLDSVSTRPGLDVVACSLRDDAFAHIGVMRANGSGLRQLTDGDSVDTEPSWTPDAPARLVYQSAGVARDGSGRAIAIGPSAIHELDVERGVVRTLAESPDHDLLSPRVSEDGVLYYLRRPWARAQRAAWRLLLDVLLLPFRLLAAVFSWLNFFTIRYSGRPLVGDPGAFPYPRDHFRQWLGWGQSIGDARRDGDTPATVPNTWQLVRQPPGAEPSVIARGVCAFDLTPTGIVWSTGSAIHHRAWDGTDERLCTGSRIAHVIALG